MSATATFAIAIRKAVFDDDPDKPSLVIHLDTSTELPGGIKLPATATLPAIANPTPDQIAAFRSGAAMVLTLAPAPSPAATSDSAAKTSADPAASK